MFKIVEYWATCGCVSNPDKLSMAIKNLYRSVVKFIKFPMCEEGSEVCFRFGRLLGSIIDKPYVFVPGDTIALDRMEENMLKCGCVNGWEVK